jgi:argininosuccinate lyase
MVCNHHRFFPMTPSNQCHRRLKLRPLALALALHGFAVGFPTAKAADIRDTACRSTEECRAEEAKIRGQLSRTQTSRVAEIQDYSYWIGRINMASTVMLSEQGIIPKAIAPRVAEGVAHAITEGVKPKGRRPADVLQVERIIEERAGPEATLIHTGRSRQDILATTRTASLRTAMLDVYEALLGFRATLLHIAQQHTETIVPAYTNGVQAQPISYAHYLHAFADSFARDAQRIREFYPRLNQSAMGTAVLANSSWRLDRERLAELLGFDRPILNAYDSSQVSFYDIPHEGSQIAASVAIRIGALMQDIHVQYHQASPWFLLASGDTYTSSNMPQKQNPGVIQETRGKTSDVLAAAQAVSFRSHNVTPGMVDYKESWRSSRVFVLTVEALTQADRVMKSLSVNRERALEELNQEWTTSVELAEVLQMKYAVPFRVGHAFASAIVEDARTAGYKPANYPFSRSHERYKIAAAKHKWTPEENPMSEADFRAALSPTQMVLSRQGLGGPQPQEVKRMLALADQSLQADQRWLADRRDQLASAEAKLNLAFTKLLP